MRRKCCCGKCAFLDYGIFANNGNELFTPVSGNWTLGGSLKCTTPAGLLLSIPETDGAGTEHLGIAFSDNPNVGPQGHREARYDLVFDYLDVDNYQVCKKRQIAGQWSWVFSRVEAGVETDLTVIPTGFDKWTYGFIRNATSKWALADATTPFGLVRGHVFDALPQFGGKKFGLRANDPQGVEVRELLCLNSVESSVDALWLSPNSPGYRWHGDAARHYCAVNPDPVRCSACIHLAPSPGEAQWKVAISGATGTAAGEFNGTHLFDPGGGTGNRASCKAATAWATSFDPEWTNALISVDLGDFSNPPGLSLGLQTWYGVAINKGDWVKQPGNVLPILNCYTDFPVTIKRWFGRHPIYPREIPPEILDVSAATVTLDLVY